MKFIRGEMTLGVGIFLFLLIFGIIITFGMNAIAEKEYNNGICPICGERYLLTAVERYETSGTCYYYTCQNCGHSIKTYRLMK